MNEEMYEEEDDDMPSYYRRLTSHIQTGDPFFNQRLQNYLAMQMENRRVLGEAVSTSMQHNPQFVGQPYMNPAHSMTPEMQTPQTSGYQNQAPAPQTFNRQMNYRQGPYPGANISKQGMKKSPYSRSMSMASPRDFTQIKQQQLQSALNSPMTTVKMEDRQTSLPMVPSTPQPQQGAQYGRASNQSSPTESPHSSKSNNSSSQQRVPTPQQSQQTQHPQPQYQRHYSYAGPFNNSQATYQNMKNEFGPLTPVLPIESQQLLAGGAWNEMNDPAFSMMMPNASNMNLQQPFYSYNPNGGGGKGKIGPSSIQPPNSEGLNQTLLAGTIDTKVSGTSNGAITTAPLSANSSVLSSAISHNGFVFGYDDGNDFLGGDLFQSTSISGTNSGQLTPADNEVDWHGLMDGDMFGGQETPA